MKRILIPIVTLLLFLSGCSVDSKDIKVGTVEISDDIIFGEPSSFSIGTKEYDLTNYSNQVLDDKYVLEIEFNDWYLFDNLPGYFQFLDDFEYGFFDEEMNPVDVQVSTSTSNRLTITSDKEIAYVYLTSLEEPGYAAWKV